MKVVILAGGLGTRISEESLLKPKPMIEIGNAPILWHIMKMYSSYGVTDFIICCGYKGYVIKEYFANYFLHKADVTFDMVSNEMTVLKGKSEPWKVTLVDTGESTMTGGRIKRIGKYVEDEESFCLTYGDGLASINIKNLIDFHKKQKKLATVTATYPPGRFGSLAIEGTNVKSFMEKPRGDGAIVNGGFFVLSPKILDYIDNDLTIWEKGPMERLAKEGNLSAFKFDGFWQPMDTLRDKMLLEQLWNSNTAPWKTWDE